MIPIQHKYKKTYKNKKKLITNGISCVVFALFVHVL